MPKLQRFNAGETPGAEALAGTLLSGAGSGLDALARETTNTADVLLKVEAAKSQQEANLAFLEVGEQLDELTLSHPDPKAYNDAAKGVIAKGAGAIKHKGAQDDFAFKAEMLRQRNTLRLKAAKAQRDLDQSGANIAVFAQGMSKRIAQSDDPVEQGDFRQMRREAIGQGLASGALTADQARALEAAGPLEEAEALAVRLERDNPILGKELAKAGEGVFGELAESDRQKVITRMTQAIKAKENEQASREADIYTQGQRARKLAEDQANDELEGLLKGNKLTTEEILARAGAIGREGVSAWLTLNTKPTDPLPSPAATEAGQKLLAELEHEQRTNPRAFARRVLTVEELGSSYREWREKQSITIAELNNPKYSTATSEALDNAATRYKFDGKGPNQTAERTHFLQRFAGEIQEFRDRNNGLEPTEAQRDAIITGFAVPISYGTFGGVSARRYQSVGEPRTLDVDVNLNGTVDQLIDFMEDFGIQDYTEADLAALYKKISAAHDNKPATPEMVDEHRLDQLRKAGR